MKPIAFLLVAALGAGCALSRPPSVSIAGEPLLAVEPDARLVTVASVRAHMEFLAGDALNGRASGSRDEWIAVTYAAAQMRRLGLEPLGDAGGYVQTIESGARRTWNAVGRLTGRDAASSGEVILLSAHIDHLGNREGKPGEALPQTVEQGEASPDNSVGFAPVRGAAGSSDQNVTRLREIQPVKPASARPDTIYNGADDDASGTVAVLELMEALARGRQLRRSIVFALFGSEERGGLGSRHFADTPTVPLPQIVANLQFEMIGRPDGEVPARTLWLTGYERSNLGPELARNGARLVADPHPEMNFFTRSDNIQFARRGVIAHTVSSYGLHKQYHTPADEVGFVDFTHMADAIGSLVQPIRWLADSDFRPEWNAGMKP